MITQSGNVAAEARYEAWVHWPVNWSAIWVGTLAALTVALIIGLIGIAVGAHAVGPAHQLEGWGAKYFSWGALVCCIVGAFFSFVIGGWVTGKIAGILRSEPAMLHGAITWLVAVPLLVALAGLGAGSFFGGWYGGLAGTPYWARTTAAELEAPAPPGAAATAAEKADYARAAEVYAFRKEQARLEAERTAKVARNTALGAVTALLLGLVGSVIGGWMASGEPMSFTHYRTRTLRAATTAEPPAAPAGEVVFRQ